MVVNNINAAASLFTSVGHQDTPRSFPFSPYSNRSTVNKHSQLVKRVKDSKFSRHPLEILQFCMRLYVRVVGNYHAHKLSTLSPPPKHTHTHTHTHTHNSYIPQTEQHEPEGRMLFCLGNVTNLLDVTPSNQISHPLSPPAIPLCVI